MSVLQNGSGDANDVWVVEVVGSPPGTVIQTAKSRLRFIHYHVRCLLHSHDKKLPKWYEEFYSICQKFKRNLRTEKVSILHIAMVFIIYSEALLIFNWIKLYIRL